MAINTRDRCNPKKMMNENADYNDQNAGSDHDYQGEDTENEREDLVNVLQWMSTFGNLERMRKEKAMINDIYCWAYPGWGSKWI